MYVYVSLCVCTKYVSMYKYACTHVCMYVFPIFIYTAPPSSKTPLNDPLILNFHGHLYHTEKGGAGSQIKTKLIQWSEVVKCSRSIHWLLLYEHLLIICYFFLYTFSASLLASLTNNRTHPIHHWPLTVQQSFCRKLHRMLLCDNIYMYNNDDGFHCSISHNCLGHGGSLVDSSSFVPRV